MSKFMGTPGPWKVRKWSGDEWPDRRISVGPESDGIATAVCISPRYCSESQAEADARLIAAAPDLLDSAQLALSIAESFIHDQLDGTGYLEGALQSLDPVRAAIAKALGEEQ